MSIRDLHPLFFTAIKRSDWIKSTEEIIIRWSLPKQVCLSFQPLRQVEPNNFRRVMNSERVSLRQSIEENLSYFISWTLAVFFSSLLKENAENDQPDLEVGSFLKGKVDNDDDIDDVRLFVCFGGFRGSIDHHSSQDNDAPFLALPRFFSSVCFIFQSKWYQRNVFIYHCETVSYKRAMNPVLTGNPRGSFYTGSFNEKYGRKW